MSDDDADPIGERLMATGTEAFARLGHDRVNIVRDILGPAKVGAGSFYTRFDDKTDLLIAIMRSARGRRLALVVPTENQSVEEFVTIAVGRFFDSLDDDGHLWQIQARERASSEPRIRDNVLGGRQVWAETFADRLAALPDVDEAAARRVGEMLVSVAMGLVGTYLDLPEDERARRRSELVATTTAFLVGGTRAVLGLDT